MISLKVLFPTLFAALLIGFTSCDDDDEGQKAQLRIEITDAPVDDPQVEAVVVTIAEVRVDGREVEGFTRQSINLLAYQNGQTKLLSDSDVEIGSHSKITLVIDGETDEDGNSPGTYIETDDGTRTAIGEDRMDLDVNGNFDVTEGADNRVIIDFDLRQAIDHTDSGSPEYTWDTEQDIEAGLRLVDYINSGTISGSVTDLLTQSDKIIVYAYTQGSFDTEDEMVSVHGENFSNAMASAAVGSTGQYTLAFMPEGTYELHFASYRDLDSDGRLELTGMLTMQSVLGPALDAVVVDANATVSLNVQVTGLLPL